MSNVRQITAPLREAAAHLRDGNVHVAMLIIERVKRNLEAASADAASHAQ